MDSTTQNSVTVAPVKTPQSNRSKPKDSENLNPNLRSPNLKSSRSPAIKSNTKTLKSASKNSNSFVSPKIKIRERKFVVAKRNSKKEKSDSAKLTCNCKDKAGKKCLCLAYDCLRASQEEFFKNYAQTEIKEEEEENKTKIDHFQSDGMISSNPDEVLELGEMDDLNNKRRRDIGLAGERDAVPEPGSGKVMSLVKAFERLRTTTTKTPEGDDMKCGRESEEKDKKWAKMDLQIKAPETQISSSSIHTSNLFLRLGSSVSSSLDSSQGSFTFSSKGSCVGHRSRRNSIELSGTFEGRRRRKRQQQLKATRQQPFKLLTEQRGKNKEEEFTKKVQHLMSEEEKLRIPIAQGLPWTTDEPENLVKPPAKERTIPIDLVLHSDVRAVDRAEFDQQLAEKMTLYEQFRMERERQQKIEEEEEIRRLRKELIPKAQPMPYFDRPFIPRRSEKHPTIPTEPKFHVPHHKKAKSCLSWDDFYSSKK